MKTNIQTCLQHTGGDSNQKQNCTCTPQNRNKHRIQRHTQASMQHKRNTLEIQTHICMYTTQQKYKRNSGTHICTYMWHKQNPQNPAMWEAPKADGSKLANVYKAKASKCVKGAP